MNGYFIEVNLSAPIEFKAIMKTLYFFFNSHLQCHSTTFSTPPLQEIDLVKIRIFIFKIFIFLKD